MSRLLECSYEDIKSLGPVDLTRLLQKLLYLEAGAAGIAATAVQVSLNINVPDGGEDGRIRWDGGRANTKWLPSRFCLFQAKATDLGPADCKSEVLIAGTSNLKPRVEEVLDARGTYILFYGRSCNPDQQAPRIDKIREAIREAGKPYAEHCHLVILDADRIAVWVSEHLSATIQVFGAVHHPLPPGLENWSSWSRFAPFARFAYVVGDATRDGALAQLRAHFSNLKQKSARLVGLSGLGKSRLALEVFRPPADRSTDLQQQLISDRLAYINAEEAGSELLSAVQAWRGGGVHGILVVDNCEKELHNILERHVKHVDSNLSLLTIGREPEPDATSTENLPYIQLHPVDDTVIVAMLKQHYGALAEADVNFIVKEIAHGFPQMAVLVADARLEKREIHIEDDLLRRMLGTKSDIASPAFQVIRHCALFEQLGMTQASADEYKWVARFADIDPDRFYEHAEQFKDRGILTKHGNFIQVRPVPLAMRLAADWWRQCSPEKAARLIGSDIPDRLAEALCERMRLLDYVPAVREFVEGLCGEQRPFGQAKVLNSELGSRLFRSLVEVNPEATARALKKAFTGWTIDDLKNVGPGRRNLVWALEKLCFWKSTFPIATPVLLSLAAAENEHWGNNSTGVFLGLFNVVLSGTQAEPKDRFSLIDIALAHADDRCRILGARALGSALKTGHFIGRAGPEQQGSRFPEHEWRPKLYKEAFAYWAEALARLARLALRHDSVAEVARNEISHHIRELVSVGRVKELNDAIAPIIEKLEGFWPAALEQVQNIREYDWDRIPDDGKAMVEKWEKQLQPKRFDKRLTLVVTEAPWETRKTASGQYVDVAAEKAAALADEATDKIDQLIPLLPQILVGSQRQAYPFGYRLCHVSADPEAIVFAALNTMESLDSSSVNPTLLTGMFAALHESHPALFEKAFAYVELREKLRPHISSITRASRLSQNHLERILRLIENGLLDPAALHGLSYGQGLDHINANFVSQFSDRLVDLGREGAWAALDVLFMYAHGDADKWKGCRASFRRIALVPNMLFMDGTKQKVDSHAFGDVVEKLLKERDEELAARISEEIVEVARQEKSRYELDHVLKPIVDVLLSKYREVSWPVLAKGLLEDGHTEFHLSNLLGSQFGIGEDPGLISKLDNDFLLRWCDVDPSRHPVLLAKMVDITERKKDEPIAFAPIARELINRFGDNVDVLSALDANMGTYSWTGSLVPYYEEQITLVSPLLRHPNVRVREWAENMISYARRQARHEQDRDAEHEIGLY